MLGRAQLFTNIIFREPDLKGRLFPTEKEKNLNAFWGTAACISKALQLHVKMLKQQKNINILKNATRKAGKDKSRG